MACLQKRAAGLCIDTPSQAGLTQHGVIEAMVEKVCAFIDTDGDGKVSAEEWAAAMQRVSGRAKAMEELACMAVRPATVRFEDVRQWREGLIAKRVTSGAVSRLVIAASGPHKGWPIFSRNHDAKAAEGFAIQLTEDRGIMVAQLVAVYLHIERYCDAEGWTNWKGEKMSAKAVDLYTLNKCDMIPKMFASLSHVATSRGLPSNNARLAHGSAMQGLPIDRKCPIIALD